MVDKGQNAPEDPSLDVHRARLSAALMTYEASLKAWRARRKIYSDMLELWDEYGQLKMNPVDKMRMECKRHTRRPRMGYICFNIHDSNISSY